MDELLGKYKSDLEKEDYNSHFKQVAGSLVSVLSIWESSRDIQKKNYRLERAKRYFEEYKSLLDEFPKFKENELANNPKNNYTPNVERYIEIKYEELRKKRLVIK